jgi:hypothetical protein
MKGLGKTKPSESIHASWGPKHVGELSQNEKQLSWLPTNPVDTQGKPSYISQNPANLQTHELIEYLLL